MRGHTGNPLRDKCASSLNRVCEPTWGCADGRSRGRGRPPTIRIHYAISSSGGRRSPPSACSLAWRGVASGKGRRGEDFRRADKTLWHALTTCARPRPSSPCRIGTSRQQRVHGLRGCRRRDNTPSMHGQCSGSKGGGWGSGGYVGTVDGSAGWHCRGKSCLQESDRSPVCTFSADLATSEP